jgi:predicted transcriptional regulator
MLTSIENRDMLFLGLTERSVMETYKGTDTELNTEILHDLLSKGVPRTSIASDLGISVHTLNKTITELQHGQGLLLKYRELQHLQLTGLQAKVLEAITPAKIEAASLVELVSAFKVLKDKELVINGKATSITGIVGYLVQLEKEEALGNEPIDVEAYEEMLEACSDAVEVNNCMPKL